MKHTWLLVFLFFSFNLAYSQNKFEHESRIKSDQVSEKARNYVESIFPDAKKLKWYLEENLDGTAIEAKLKARRTTYSIKFDTLGNLHDIEFIQTVEDLDSSIQQKINKYFTEQYERHRIKKIQKQYVGDAEILRSVILNGAADNKYQTFYEIEVSGKKDGDYQAYEVLFSHEGEHVETKKIIPRNLNHLIY